MLKAILEKLGFTAEEIDSTVNNPESIEGVLERISKKLESPKPPEATESQELKDAQSAVLANENAFKAERLKRAELVIANAVYDGKITEAQRNDEVEILANSADFEKSVAAIDKRPAVVKTKSQTDGIQKEQNELSKSDAIKKIKDLVRIEVDKGASYKQAWNLVKAKELALFEKAFPTT